MSLAAQKAQARKAAFARRQVAFERGGDAQAAILTRVLTAHAGSAIAGYHPIRSEIDPTPAMVLAAERGPVALPVIVAAGAPLVFHRWTPQAELKDGPFGVRIPASVDPVVPDVVIVPLVAFDRRGGRLGYGGGFYDRTLEALRARGQVLSIGFAFGAQEADELPLEPVDQPLDMIVTEDEVIRPKAGLTL